MSKPFYPNIVSIFRTGSSYGKVGLTEKGRILHQAAYELLQLQEEELKW